MADSENDGRASALVRLWRWFWSPTGRFSWGAIFIAGGLAGIVFWGGFNTFMEFSNTQTFCTGCHEMRDFVYAEYKDTRSGPRKLDARLSEISMGFRPLSSTRFARSTPHRVYTG